MKRVLIFSENNLLIKSWSSALSPIYQISKLDDIDSEFTADAVIIDSQKIDSNNSLLSNFSYKSTRFLIVGSNWPENNQINALIQGAAGYCEASESPKLMIQALEQILKGDIWIQRLLVPKVIGSLMKIKTSEVEAKKNSSSSKLFESLSSREMDVAKMIQAGKNNKTIASSLYISERTVKAHLTSIFKKLNIPSRLHLAVFIKELS
ncbi:MAG: response regulator transcription factor [Methylococcaceae bacterium]|nr:response regulator transcription factor [Methylococcaceae bacterium]